MYIALLTTLGVTLQVGLATAQTKVTVDAGTTYQVIDGFGFSEAFGFGGGVENAPAAQQTQALNYMFSTTEGAGMTILRNRIAADPNGTIEPNSPGSPSTTPSYRSIGDDASQVRIIYSPVQFQQRTAPLMC
jgi:O-glycosyl hydrolase